MQILSNAIEVSHCLLQAVIKDASLLVDATCGNGEDTAFLGKYAPKAHIYAFDIQKTAIEEAKKRTTAYRERISFICGSHLEIDKYIKSTPIDAVLFNLGYLPGGKHEITTQANTVLQAVDHVKDLLKTNGFISLIAYPGHAEGAKEYKCLREYTKGLNKHHFTACWYQLYNHTDAPTLCWIEKQE